MTDSSFKIDIQTDDNGDCIIEWDENHPGAIELGCNNWTEEDWIARLTDALLASAIDEQEEA